MMKEQELISLRITASEKDETLVENNQLIEKYKNKSNKFKSKMIDFAELNAGLEDRITLTENKYFSLEMKLSEKESEMKDKVTYFQGKFSDFENELKTKEDS